MEQRLSAHRDGDEVGRLMRVGNGTTTRLPAASTVNFLRPLAVMCADRLPPRGMFIVPHGAPEGYEWFVALVVLVGLYFAVRNFMRARR